MRNRLVLSIVLAVAMLGTVTVVTILAQGGSVPSKIPPTKALQAAQIANLPAPVGTAVTRASLPRAHGRLRILPSDSGGSESWKGIPLGPGRSITKAYAESTSKVETCRTSGLFVEPKYLPAGWQFQGCYMERSLLDNGETIDAAYSASYWQPGYFPIAMHRLLLRPDVVVDLVNPADTFALTLGDSRGVPIVIRHAAPGIAIQGPFEVYFVTNDRLTTVEGAGIEVGQLIRIAESIITEIQGGRP